MHRFEQGRIEFENINPNMVPSSEVGDYAIEQRENKNENASAWESLIKEAEEKIEEIKKEISLLESPTREYKGEVINEERRFGLLKQYRENLELQKSIINMAKNNL